MTAMKIHLLIIDPQLDFCDCPDFAGSLPVTGAHADMTRLAAMIRRTKKSIDDIHVTLDSHHIVDIAHPIWWKDSKGNSPAPFTPISAKDVESGVWKARNPSYEKESIEYVKALEKSGRYGLLIWPEHCIIGSRGHSIHADVLAALNEWERDNFAMFEVVTKGSNMLTEHYSAVQAEVPNSDPSTQLNGGLIATLQEADMVLIAGEALSHCVANTVRDIAANFGSEPLEKLVLLEDATSSVPGFEQAGKDFIAEMTKKGMRLMKTTDFAA